MADGNADDRVKEFAKVTGVDHTAARMYLESAGGDFNLAVERFYDDDDDDAEVVSAKPDPKPAAEPVPSRASTRVATLASLKQNDDDDASEEEGQAFYAGGSVRSGQQVLGPGKRKSGAHIVEEMLRAAKSHGAEVVDPEENRRSAQLRAFQGTGHVLGSSDSSSANASALDTSNEDSGVQSVNISLRAFRNGFTVGHGPLRDYTDPANKEFLDAIQKGKIPGELFRSSKGNEINLCIEDHRHEDYVPPKPQLMAFSGTGHRLGSPTPPISVSTSEDNTSNETEAVRMLNLNPSAPITAVQIRLADGSRLVVKLNHSHTVGDIRRYLVTARPEYSASVFSLMTTYPQKELKNDNATVEEENLLNSVIVQKLQ